MANSINEGRTAVFQVKSTDNHAEDLRVFVELGEHGNFMGGKRVESVVVQSGKSVATIEVPTHDDGIAEDDGTIFATVLQGGKYTVGLNKIASVAVTDAADRLQWDQNVSTAVYSVVPNLLAASASNVLDTASERGFQKLCLIAKSRPANHYLNFFGWIGKIFVDSMILML